MHFSSRGKEVTVVEMADRILPIQLNETAGTAYRKLFEEHGCRFLLGKKASETHMNSNGSIDYVLLDDGTRVDCDRSLLLPVFVPQLNAYWILPIEVDRFIKVSDTMETSCKDIYAAGDVTGLSGIWPNAMKQGQVAAMNMCGIKTLYEDRYAMKKYDELLWTGYAFPWKRNRRRGRCCSRTGRFSQL